MHKTGNTQLAAASCSPTQPHCALPAGLRRLQGKARDLFYWTKWNTDKVSGTIFPFLVSLLCCILSHFSFLAMSLVIFSFRAHSEASHKGYPERPVLPDHVCPLAFRILGQKCEILEISEILKHIKSFEFGFQMCSFSFPYLHPMSHPAFTPKVKHRRPYQKAEGVSTQASNCDVSRGLSCSVSANVNKLLCRCAFFAQ